MSEREKKRKRERGEMDFSKREKEMQRKKGRKTLFGRKGEVRGRRKERKEGDDFLEERMRGRERVSPSCVDKKEEKGFFGTKGEREREKKKEKRIFWKEG